MLRGVIFRMGRDCQWNHLPKELEADSTIHRTFQRRVGFGELAVTGWDDTMTRCEEYVEAGADMLFIEALRNPEEAGQVAARFEIPLMYNFVETGKSPLIPAAELERLGFKMVIYPVSAMLTVCNVVGEMMRQLKDRGTTEHLMDNMVSVVDAFELVGLSPMLERDASYSNTAVRAAR